MIVLGEQETKDLAAICRLYLSVDPLQPIEDSKRRRELARRIIQTQQGDEDA